MKILIAYAARHKTDKLLLLTDTENETEAAIIEIFQTSDKKKHSRTVTISIKEEVKEL